MCYVIGSQYLKTSWPANGGPAGKASEQAKYSRIRMVTHPSQFSDTLIQSLMAQAAQPLLDLLLVMTRSNYSVPLNHRIRSIGVPEGTRKILPANNQDFWGPDLGTSAKASKL